LGIVRSRTPSLASISFRPFSRAAISSPTFLMARMMAEASRPSRFIREISSEALFRSKRRASVF